MEEDNEVRHEGIWRRILFEIIEVRIGVLNSVLILSLLVILLKYSGGHIWKIFIYK